MNKQGEKDDIDGLNPQRMKFINYYIELGHGTEAAKKAGYSEKSAHVTASRLLKNDKILAEIRRIYDDITESMKFRKESLLAELWRIGKTDVREAFDENGALKKLEDMPDSVARSIKSVQIDELFERDEDGKHHIGYTKRIQFHDKIKAIELYGKEKNMFKDKVEVKVKNYSDKFKQARERIVEFNKRKQSRESGESRD